MAQSSSSRSLALAVAVADVRPDFIGSKRRFRKAHTVKNYRWALNVHQEVHPFVCWQPQEVVAFVWVQSMAPSVKRLLYELLQVFYAWARSWVKAHHPGTPDLPSLPWVPYTYWSHGKRRKRKPSFLR